VHACTPCPEITYYLSEISEIIRIHHMVVDKKNNDRFINYIIIKNMISNSYLMIKG
jgi:hypothetical protein